MSYQILIIDDETNLRQLTARYLTVEGYQVREADKLQTATTLLRDHIFHAVICDVKLPDGNGVAYSATIKQQYPDTEVIVLTAYGNIEDGVQAIKSGAFDYLTKGDHQHRLLPLLQKACEKAALQFKVRQLEQKLDKQYGMNSILGTSAPLLAARQLAIKVAATDAPVLLTGETGTGKEVFAQAIHHSSRRNQQPFIAINCSALSKDLLESELFGHLAGAFTGASKDKKGLVEAADKGTLFLDEIGEMPAELQAKLLRVLESQTFTKVGDTQTRKVDIRIIAATHRNLQQESQAGRFREDLYFRLSVMEIHLPSLNERRDDIPALAQYYLNSFNSKLNKNITGISEACMDALTHHHWRGNIRELRNVIERAMILCDGNLLDKTDLPYDFQEMPAAAPTTSAKLADIERQHILRTLEATGGNKTEAARLLDIGLATLYRKLEIYGVH